MLPPTTITLASGEIAFLGRTPTAPKDLERRLFLRDFVTATTGGALPVRDAIDWHATAMQSCPVNGLDDGLGNVGRAGVGDCAFAAPGHMIQIATACESLIRAESVTTTSIKQAYFAYTGNRDVGANLGQVLKLWQQKGICGYKISSYLAIDPADEDMLRWACDYLGGLYVACSLPSNWQNQQTLWDANAGRIAGGHAVVLSGYTAQGPIYDSWGVKVPGTWAGWHQYFDEAYAVILDAWTAKDGRCPAGLNLAAIERQVQLVQAKSCVT
jgi:hypothetical protein